MHIKTKSEKSTLHVQICRKHLTPTFDDSFLQTRSTYLPRSWSLSIASASCSSCTILFSAWTTFTLEPSLCPLQASIDTHLQISHLSVLRKHLFFPVTQLSLELLYVFFTFVQACLHPTIQASSLEQLNLFEQYRIPADRTLAHYHSSGTKPVLAHYKQ